METTIWGLGFRGPNNRVPLKGIIGGYIGIVGDYIRVQGPMGYIGDV